MVGIRKEPQKGMISAADPEMRRRCRPARCQLDEYSKERNESRRVVRGVEIVLR